MNAEHTNWTVNRIVEALRANTGKRLSTSTLMALTGCSQRRIYLVMSAVKRRLSGQGLKLCNLRGVGYWIAGCEADKLDEAAKEYRRMISHGAAGNRTMALVERAKITTPEDMELYGINVAMRAMTQAMLAANGEVVGKLLSTAGARHRLETAGEQAQAPLALIGISGE